MERQKFTREDIERAVEEGVPQYGGAGYKKRLIGFPSRPLGEGNVSGSESWFEDLNGGDAVCVIHFVESYFHNLGHGNMQTVEERLMLDGEHRTLVPREVFEFVWSEIRSRVGNKQQPSA